MGGNEAMESAVMGCAALERIAMNGGGDVSRLREAGVYGVAHFFVRQEFLECLAVQ